MFPALAPCSSVAIAAPVGVARQAEHVVHSVGSHQAISSSRQKPESPRSTMRTFGQGGGSARRCARPPRPRRPPRRCWHGRSRAPAGARRRRCRAAGSSSVVVAVEEPALLLAVQRIVGRVQIEHDLLAARARAPPGTGRRAARRSPPGRSRPCDSGVGCRPAQLQPVQRTLAGQRRAVARRWLACRPAPPATDRDAACRDR